MRIVAIINAKTGALCLQEMVDQGDEIVAVICPPDDPWPGIEPGWSVREVATRNYLPVYQPPPREVNNPRFVEAMRKLKPDFLVAMHYGVIFKDPLLSTFPLGAVNIHPTRLPSGQGKTPSCWHYLMGDDKNWITLHWLDKGIDTGAIIVQGWVSIDPEESGHESTNKLLIEGHRIFKESLPLLREGKAPRINQDQIEGIEQSYYRWEPGNARIPWELPAEKVITHIRALCHPKETPTYSGEAFSYIGGVKVSVWWAKASTEKNIFTKKAKPGEILAIYGEGLLVQTGKGEVLLTDVDVQGSSQKGISGLIEILNKPLPLIFN